MQRRLLLRKHSLMATLSIEALLKAAAERDVEAKDTALEITYARRVQDAWDKLSDAKSRSESKKALGALVCVHESSCGHEEDDRVAHYLFPLTTLFEAFSVGELVALEVPEVAHLLPSRTMETLYEMDKAPYVVDFSRVRPSDVLFFTEWHE